MKHRSLQVTSQTRFDAGVPSRKSGEDRGCTKTAQLETERTIYPISAIFDSILFIDLYAFISE